MINYCQDRINWYLEKLKEANFYVSRNSSNTEVATAYLISATDWRYSVIITCQLDKTFRLSFLYVNEEDSFSFSENDFSVMLEKITTDFSLK
jgi:hypothetical protein